MGLWFRLITVSLLLVPSMALTACGGGAQPAPAAEAQEANAPAPGPTGVLADLIRDWREQRDIMLRIADAMPEDSYDYRSTPSQRSFGEQVLHVAEINVGLLPLLGGTAAAPSVSEESAVQKAAALQALAESYDYGLDLLTEQTDASISETVDASFLGPSTRARVVWFLLGHSMDIYGQMAVYLRMNDIVPPASGGA